MKNKARRVWLSALALHFLLLAAPELWAQENPIDLSRILQPFPEYDPFDKPPPAPEFFPDEIDKRAREAMIDSLTNQSSKLEDHARFFKEKDAGLKRARGTVTGLSDQVLDLYHSTIADRRQYLEAQEKALSSASSPQHKKLIESRLRNDELRRAEEFAKRSALNRVGGAVNTFLSSVDLISIVSGSYVAAAVDAALNQVLRRSKDMSEEDRRALVLYREYLNRNPADPKNAEIRKRIESLETKHKNAVAAKELNKAEEALGKGELTRAGFHYELAALMDPQSKKAQAGLDQVHARLGKEKELRERTLQVNPDTARDPLADDAPRELTDLLYALALREPQAIEAAATRAQTAFPAQPMGEAAKDASAAALEIQGKHEQATKLLQNIAKTSKSPSERKRAQILLKNPEYNLLASFHEARSQHKLDTIKFVLLGEDFLKKNLLIGTAPMIAHGAAGATTLGAANVLIVGTNLLSVLTSNAVSSQEILDKGVAYIRSHPESESATEIYRVLGEAYEKAGMYERALAYYEMAGKLTQQKTLDLKEKSAKNFLTAAEKSGDGELKKLYLASILENYPDSAAAKAALQKLAKLSKNEHQGMRISKQFLLENPDLYGPNGLRLKPSLFDRNPSNMELADLGLHLTGDREILLHFQTPWGIQSQLYAVEKEILDNFRVTLRNKNYDLALQDVNTRPKGSLGGLRNLPPSLLHGEWASKQKAATEETDLTFRREAGLPSGSSPSGSSAELVAESEKDPRQGIKLPPISGSVSGSSFNLTGSVGAGIWGDRVSIGTDERSPYASLQLPIPLLQGFIPVDFLFQGRPGRLSIFPQIHTRKEQTEDKELYR